MKKKKCGWCLGDAQYEQYHDTEWGVPVYDDQTLFEFLILETMQAGLSWITVLRKRNNYRKALDHFNVDKIAQYDESKVQELMNNSGLIRHELKVRSIIKNAIAFKKVQEKHGSFSKYIWNFADHEPIKNKVKSYHSSPSRTALSDRITKDLKKNGFKFVGSVTIYAYMQAIGMVNDHEVSCFRYDEV